MSWGLHPVCTGLPRPSVAGRAATAVALSLGLLAQPVWTKREVKGRLPNCSFDCNHAGTALEVLDQDHYDNTRKMNFEEVTTGSLGTGARTFSPISSSLVSSFLPNLNWDALTVGSSEQAVPRLPARWSMRRGNSEESVEKSRNFTPGEFLEQVWRGDEGGQAKTSCIFDKSGGFTLGCRTTCVCPSFMQCYVHNEERDDSVQDIGECQISIGAQVFISFLTIAFLVCLLLLARMALIQYQVRQELLLRESQQRDSVIREIERRKFTTSKGRKEKAKAAANGNASGKPEPKPKSNFIPATSELVQERPEPVIEEDEKGEGNR